MSYFPEMEWSAKWDVDNFVAFGSKAIESPKKLQLGNWSIVDNGEIDIESFNQSGGGGNSGASGSDGGHGSSSKSFLSASTDSHGFITFEGSSGNLSKKIEMKGTKTSGTSPPLNASIGSMEPLMGLKLGKRTYFENSSVRGNVKNTFHSVVPAPSTTAQKKTKSSAQNSPIPRCQVLGCNVDLSTAKEYHRKHKVCDIHSKCPKVIVGGHERRFCQQCSRFHNLSEFDEKKRSCRHRLSDHNARRRKPHQEAMHFNSMRLSSPLYGGMQRSVIYSKTSARSAWDSTFNSKFTLTKGCPLKSDVNLGTDEHFQVPGIKLPPVMNSHGHAASGLLVYRSPPPDVLSRGSKGSLTHLDAAPQNGRALSLLSNNNFWGLREPESVPVRYQNDYSVSQPMMTHAIREGTSLSTDFWQTGQHSTRPYVQPFSTNNNFQESQLFKPAYGSDFYSNMLN